MRRETYVRATGFTLIELIVTVIIVAILLVLALPDYQRQLRNTRRSLGSAELLQVMRRQEQHFLDHKRYAGVLTDLDYPASPYAIDAEGRTVSALAGDRIYLIDLELRGDDYTLYARPQLSQSRDVLCGTLSLDSNGTKSVSGDGAARECW